jgi:cytochrome b pre-mRNA-processing protein 3
MPESSRFSQALFDYFCSDLDANLRELGVGDLTVPKRMQAFGEAFYGRAAAYDMAIASGPDEMSKALCRNVLNGFGMDNGRKLASYVEQSVAALDRASPAQLRSGTWRFPPPAIT